MQRILVGSDLSARSGHALQRAVAIAAHFGGMVEAITVVEETFYDGTTKQKAAIANEGLAAQIRKLTGTEGLTINQHVTVGMDFELILRRADEMDADLIVLGPHRHATREMFRGTTAERVIRHGTRPVLVVRQAPSGPYRRSLVASDLSPQAEAAAMTAAALTGDGTVLLLHAVQRSFSGYLDRQSQDALVQQDRNQAITVLDGTKARLGESSMDAMPHVEILLPEGPIIETLTEETARQQADLLAMGTHGRSGLARAVLGSVAETFLACSPVDVLVARAG